MAQTSFAKIKPSVRFRLFVNHVQVLETTGIFQIIRKWSELVPVGSVVELYRHAGGGRWVVEDDSKAW